MNKGLIKNFIKLYFLNGINEQSIWKNNNTNIKVDLLSSCKSLITYIQTKKNIINLKDDIAIFNNGQFLNLLNLFNDNDEKFKLLIDDRKIQLKGDLNIKPIYILADKDIINNDGSDYVKKCESLDDWSANFKLNKEDISLLSKSKAALPNAKVLFINEDKIVIGNDTQSENRVEFNIKTNIDNNFDEKLFNLDFFISIISLLEDNVTCYIHDKGMLRIYKETDDFICNYYIMALQQ